MKTTTSKARQEISLPELAELVAPLIAKQRLNPGFTETVAAPLSRAAGWLSGRCARLAEYAAEQARKKAAERQRLAELQALLARHLNAVEE